MITPIGDKVVIERVPSEEIVNGVHIPESVRWKTNWARIVALGTGKPDFEFSLKVGDKVLMPGHLRTDFDHDGKRLIVMKEGELLAVAEEAV